MARKPSKKRPSNEELAAVAAKEFVSKGYAKTSLEDLAEAASLTTQDLKSLFSSKDELAAQAFRIGRQLMELASQRLTSTVLVSDYLSQIFDGLVASTEPWGPEGYFNIFYQATKNKELRGLVKKASQDTLLVLKFYINDMIDHDLITERVSPEAVAEDFLSKFIEDLALLTKERGMEEVKRRWIQDAASILREGEKGNG